MHSRLAKTVEVIPQGKVELVGVEVLVLSHLVVLAPVAHPRGDVKVTWVGQHLYNLLNLLGGELCGGAGSNQGLASGVGGWLGAGDSERLLERSEHLCTQQEDEDEVGRGRIAYGRMRMDEMWCGRCRRVEMGGVWRAGHEHLRRACAC